MVYCYGILGKSQEWLQTHDGYESALVESIARFEISAIDASFFASYKNLSTFVCGLDWSIRTDAGGGKDEVVGSS
jgi:hypothetical protein